MCSIIGVFSKEEIENNFIEHGHSLMQHRGPENSNHLKIKQNVELGHQRLSIIDLSINGNQPMETSDSVIVFNGEIYNYIELREELEKFGIIFTTESDTEVLLKGFEMFGPDFLKKLNGMFSFCFYSKAEEILYLVRDRFGIKPLYYKLDDKTLLFASEIKPLINFSKDVSLNYISVNSYIKDTATDYDSETFFNDIYQVERGQLITVNAEFNIVKKKWYSEIKNNNTYQKKVSNVTEEIENLLIDSIKIRLRSDVPLGITLSGGVDSSVLYCLIREHFDVDITPFTLSHPNKNTDEFDAANNLAKYYGDTSKKILSETDLNINNIKFQLNKLESPIWSFVAQSYQDVYKNIKNSGITVLIEGHGSDELFGGYPYMIFGASTSALRSLKINDFFKYQKASKNSKHESLYIDTDINLKKVIGKYYRGISNILNNKNKFNLLMDEAWEYKILPIVLRTFDRMTMAESLESRAPYLDYRLVEYVKSLPTHQKVSPESSKTPLREILIKYGHDDLANNNKKLGFTSDIEDILNNQKLKDSFKNLLEESNLPKLEIHKIKALELLEDDLKWGSDSEYVAKIVQIFLLVDLFGLK